MKGISNIEIPDKNPGPNCQIIYLVWNRKGQSLDYN
jgi:hypothetical protein